MVYSLSACNRLPGTYVANYNVGADTIKIFSDHKYVKVCVPPNDTTHYIDSGTWELLDGSIYFRDCVDRNGMLHGDSDEHFIFGAEIRSNYLTGSVKLPISYDLDYYYIKK